MPSVFGVMKCFTFEHRTNDPINEVYVALNNSLHPKGIRSAFARFFVSFHYPDQVIRGFANRFYDWPPKNIQMEDYYSMIFSISNVEILKRRKSGKEQCYDWKDYDLTTIEEIMGYVGCRPPYWTSRRGDDPCDSQAQLGEFYNHLLAKIMQVGTFQQYKPWKMRMG